jgi:hypothetical protein
VNKPTDRCRKHEWGRGEYGRKCIYCEAVNPKLMPKSSG